MASSTPRVAFPARHRIVLATALAVVASVLLNGAPWPSASAVAQWPTTADAGFRSATLLYQEDGLNPSRVAPYLVHHDPQGRPARDGWLFDLIVTLPPDQSFAYGPAAQADWDRFLDAQFDPGGTISDIDRAVTDLSAATATDGAPLGAPPRRVSVAIGVPYPEVTNTAFAYQGSVYDLSQPAQRSAAVGAYLDQVQRRFQSGGYTNVSLWGAYWAREDAHGSDVAHLPAITSEMKERGLKSLWVPYYSAPGYDDWDAFGFDVAVLQPSLAFTSPRDGGATNLGRLAVTAARARSAGMGVEIEARGGAGSPSEHALLEAYLASGTREGWQAGPKVHFIGTVGNNLVDKAMSGNSSARAAYDSLTSWNQGDIVPWPGPVPVWRSKSPSPGAQVRTAILQRPVSIREVSAVLVPGWQGTITVSGSSASGWVPLGWAATPAAFPAGAPLVDVSAPTDPVEVSRVRVVFTPAPGVKIQPNVERMLLTAAAAVPATASLAVGGTAQVSPPPPVGDYPDRTGNVLTDGAAHDGPWTYPATDQVGWNGTPGGWGAVIDLGRSRDVARVVVHTNGGGYGGIHYPTDAAAVLASCPVAALAGPGAPPCRPVGLSGALRQVGGSGNNTASTITFSSATSSPARYVTVGGGSDGWVMVSEIEVFDRAGTNVAAGSSYRLSPAPSAVGAPGYPDNQARLTDGLVADEVNRPMSTGWPSDSGGEVSVSLPSAARSRAIDVWAVSDPAWGVVAPSAFPVRVETADGRTIQASAACPSTSPTPATRCRADLGEIVTPVSIRVTVPAGGSAGSHRFVSEVAVVPTWSA